MFFRYEYRNFSSNFCSTVLSVYFKTEIRPNIYLNTQLVYEWRPTWAFNKYFTRQFHTIGDQLTGEEELTTSNVRYKRGIEDRP